MNRVPGNGALTGFRKYLGPWLLLPLLVVLLGCGKNGVSRASIHGTVSVGGQPIEHGQIVFVPTGDNSGPTAGAAIKNGAYAITAQRGPKIGTNQVQISGKEKTGRKIPNYIQPGGPELDEIREVVPERYRGTGSILEYEVVRGDQEKDFELDAQ